MKREVKETITFSPKKNRNRSPKSAKKGDRSSAKLSSLKGVTVGKSKKQHSKLTKKANSAPNSKGKLRKPKKKSLINTKNPIVISGLLLLRLTVLLIGISTIFGSIMAVANSFDAEYTAETTNEETTQITTEQSSNLANLFSLLEVGQEIKPLKEQLETIIEQYPNLEAGILIADTENNRFVEFLARETFSSASTVKLPILIAFFQDVDAGKINLSESLKITNANIAEGSGYMQYEPVGKRFTAIKTATDMIAVSDNTATNMIIERLGGAEALNQRFRDWGLKTTQLSDRLPDLEGNNTTSTEDLSNLLLQIDRGELVSLRSRDRILSILKQTKNNSLLPKGIDQNAAIAHKTGDIKSVLGDTGIVDMPNGKRYIISVLVKRPDNDSQAQSLIQQLSSTAYQYFEQEELKSPPQTQFSKPGSFLAP